MAMTKPQSAIEDFLGVVWVCNKCGHVAKAVEEKDAHEHDDWIRWLLDPDDAEYLEGPVENVPPMIAKDELSTARSRTSRPRRNDK